MRRELYSGSTQPTFSRVHWPHSRGFDNVCTSRMGQWIARPHWTQIRNWDKGGSVDAKQGKLGFTPRAIIIQDGKAREGHRPPPIILMRKDSFRRFPQETTVSVRSPWYLAHSIIMELMQMGLGEYQVQSHLAGLGGPVHYRANFSLVNFIWLIHFGHHVSFLLVQKISHLRQ